MFQESLKVRTPPGCHLLGWGSDKMQVQRHDYNPNTVSIRQILALSVSKAFRKFGLMNRVARDKECCHFISSYDFYTCVTQTKTRKNSADMKTWTRTPWIKSIAHIVCILHWWATTIKLLPAKSIHIVTSSSSARSCSETLDPGDTDTNPPFKHP